MTSLPGAVADLLWPPQCVACSTKLSGEDSSDDLLKYLCPLCAHSVILASKPWCTKCGLPFESAGKNHLCSACITQTPPFEWARSIFQYGGSIAEAIQRFKYNGTTQLSGPLGKLMVFYLKKITEFETHSFDLTIPMPLHPNKLKSRQYNQSALLARHIATECNAPLNTSVLVRIKETENQAGLTRSERVKNVEDAFDSQKQHKVKDKNILLVDDVITSTATIREASSTLIKAGAKSVSVLSLARSTGVSF